MIEIFLLIGAISAIALFARGRGGSPWVWGTVAVIGFVVLRIGGAAFVASFQEVPFEIALLSTIASWIGVGLVFLYVRFVMGRGRPQPTGMWACTNCTYLNKAGMQFCEACKQPWSPKSKPADTNLR